ncbi:TPA: hypothetical protein P2Q98_000257 [Aeromonas veronii]|uniref:hypothetical protein n=1 Tax=Aeromonas veronii TaxID=654 RepID=UPI003308C0D8|nr:hypothetical protein [Aeromonas veronii]HDO1332165.1 hypothetical protein [Aeromonas veronii]HDO1339082.1 hypothetical protein [Aeromonas veronii]HDO1341225.1 hypothetical protein [Aeromonas veronii]HDO1345799.1 hypothetical protein [Aeromonas veronii]
MAKQLVTDIVINLAGNLAAKSRQYGQSMNQFAASNQRAMNMVKMSSAAAGRGIDSLGNRYVALGTAMVGGAAVRGYAQLDRRISRIAIAADISRDKAKELKDEINAVSNTKGIRIDPNEATSAVEEILTKTGDLAYAIENLPNIAAVIQATGAGGLEVGGIFTEFKKLAIDSSEAAMKAIDTLNVQGKEGAFTLAALAKEGPKIFAAYAATGRQGADAVTELGAALQVIKGGVGSEAEAVTAFESLIRDITRPETVKKLKQLGGIEVFDPDQLKLGKEVMRSLPALIEEIVTKSKGLSTNLAMLNLTDEAKRALKPVIAEFVQTGDVKAFDKFMDIAGDGSTTLNDAAVAASDFAASLQLVSNSWNQFANQQLAAPIAELADAINSLEPDAVQRWLEVGSNIALAVGGVVVAKKTLDAIKWGKETWGSLKPSKGGAGGLGGAMADLGATPVYVVNMPGGGMGGMGGGADLPGGESGKGGGKGGKYKRFVKAAPALAGGAAFTLLYAASESEEAKRLKAESDKAQQARATLPSAPMLSNKDAYALLANASQEKPVRDNPYAQMAKAMLVPVLDPAMPAPGIDGRSVFASSLGSSDIVGGMANILADFGSLLSPTPLKPQQFEGSLDIKVSDDRITVRARDAAPGLSVRVDNGPSLMP